jgi:predicted  nucleic acid-binding Zn-ribbon protein
MPDSTTTLADLNELLRLQELDSTIDQLVAKRGALPAHDVIESVQADAMMLRPQLQEAAFARDALKEKQDSLESDVAVTEKRIAEINNRLYDGSAKLAPNDALAMSQEVRHLKERQSSFEDQELEIMEQLEMAEAVVAPLQQQAQALAGKLQVAQTDVTNGQAQIDAEIQGIQAMRATVVVGIAEPLLAEYEKLRKRLGGVAVAALVGNSCGGCHISMSATEVSALRTAPESALLHCEECDRLLIRPIS